MNYLIYTQEFFFAQVGVRVNSVLIRNDCIKYYISLFTKILLHHLDAFQTEIHGSLTKLCAFKASRGHPSEVLKLLFCKGTLDFNFECIKFLQNDFRKQRYIALNAKTGFT